MRSVGTLSTVHVAEVAGLGAVLAYVLGVQAAANSGDYELWAALTFVPILVLVSVYLIERASRVEQGPWLLRLLLVAFALKALATVARYWMAFVMYDGVADAGVYHDEGTRLAISYRAGDFTAELSRDFIGTGFIQALTGALYTLTGSSIYVAYAFFAWLGFWGLYFFVLAFRTALPDGDQRRYAVLVLLLPSMLFWPSGLGKEAWMTLGIGLTAVGTARLLRSHRQWLVPLSSGLVATALVRPHITAALFAGIAAAVVLRKSQHPATLLTPLTRAAAIGTVLLVGMVIVNRTAEFLGIGDLSTSNVDAAIAETGESTAQGGSEFEAQQVNSPLMMPWATLSVLFRPFPFEVDSAQALLAAAEGSLLMLLTVMSLRRLRWIAGRLRDYPYLIVCIVYTLLFVYAFSSFANFGILTRQRVQVLPFVLVFLALPRPLHPRGDSAAHRNLQEATR